MLMHNNYLGCRHPINVLHVQAYIITAIILLYAYCTLQTSGVVKGWGHAAREAGLKSASEHFLQLSDQSRLKNANF